MTFVWGVLGLGFLVFFHELGHFIAARSFGVKVEAFSVGIGPVLLHKKIGETDYRLSLIPLGGYCSMKGEHDFQNAIENRLSSIKADEDSFYGIHPLKRFVIAFAGPFSNYIIGFLSFVIIALIGYSYYSASSKVYMADDIYPEMLSPAHEAGMLSGDEILSINGKSLSNFGEIVEFISVHPDEDLTVSFLRDGEQSTVNIHSLMDVESGRGKIGIVSDPSTIEIRIYPGKNFFESIIGGFKETCSMIELTFKGFQLIFKGVNLRNAVSGPVRITSMFGESVQEGFRVGFKAGIVSTLELLGLISLSLFITNLLPVPVLDGGLIVVSLIEAILHRKTHPKVLYYIQIAGAVLLFSLMLFALFNDIMYFIGR